MWRYAWGAGWPGRYAGATGVVDNAVFQRTVNQPHEYAPAYHVALNTGPMVTARWDQLVKLR